MVVSTPAIITNILLMASFLVHSHTALISRLSFWYLESNNVETMFTPRAINPNRVIVEPLGIKSLKYL